MKKSILVGIILIASFVFLLSSPVLAQTVRTVSPTPSFLALPVPTNGLNLTLSPTYITLVTDPGKEVKSEFKVTNNSSSTENLEISIAKIQVGADGKPVLADLTQSDAFGKWLQLETNQVTLKANQSKTIRFTISPPSDAALGYYYTLLVRRVKTGSETGGAQAVISGSAGIPVLLEVRSPNAKKELQVQSFKTDKLFYEYLPVRFDVEVKNTGNVQVIPFGDIFIDSMFHKQIAIIHANPGRGNVLAGSVRTFSDVWDDAFAVNQPKVENGVPIKDAGGRNVLETNYDFSKANKFRIGKYTAHLLMVYDNGERDIPVEGTVSFWIIPWKIMLGGLVVILAPAILVFLLMRMAYRKR